MGGEKGRVLVPPEGRKVAVSKNLPCYVKAGAACCLCFDVL